MSYDPNEYNDWEGQGVEVGAPRIEKGTWVQLRQRVGRQAVPDGREDHRTAYVLNVNDEGGVHVHRDLNGMRWWHVTDLQRARHQGKSPIRSA